MKIYLAQVRYRKGISGRQLSKMTGIARSYINKIENEFSNPSINVLCRLARALGVEITDLFDCKK